jgi:hypothetical protein
MDKMKAHILDGFSSLIHLLFDENNTCRVGKDFEGLDMKIFFMAMKGMAEIGLSATELSCQQEAIVKKQQLRELYPDYFYLLLSSVCLISRSDKIFVDDSHLLCDECSY